MPVYWVKEEAINRKMDRMKVRERRVNTWTNQRRMGYLS